MTERRALTLEELRYSIAQIHGAPVLDSDQELDSMSMLEVLILIDDEYGIEVDPARIAAPTLAAIVVAARGALAMGDSTRFPSLVGRRVALRSVSPRDYEWIHHLVASGTETAIRWRFRGYTPSASQLDGMLFAEVEVLLAVTAKDSGEPFGFCQLYSYDPRNGLGFVAAVLRPEIAQKGWPLEGLILFLDYCFTTYPLRKVYFESIAFNVKQFASAVGPYLVEEARLREHVFHDGTYHDLVSLALYRSTWEENRQRFIQDNDKPTESEQ